MLVGVRGVGEWQLTYGEDDHRFRTELPGKAEEAGFMVPPTWTCVVPSSGASILTARLIVSSRITLAGLIVQPAPVPDDQAIADAALAAQDAATAVVVVGLTPEQETEAVDKSTLSLPGRQDDLVRAVAGAARIGPSW